jgi:hypothetical protein
MGRQIWADKVAWRDTAKQCIGCEIAGSAAQSGSRRKRVLSPFLRDILFTSERKGRSR